MQEVPLAPTDFAAFFKALWGFEPFPWQERLLLRLATGTDARHGCKHKPGQWPDVLDLPTGSGKTAALDIAVFHLALEAERRDKRRAPVRIAFVVDRRLIVDDAYERAQSLARKLKGAVETPSSAHPVVLKVALALCGLAGSAYPLIACRLRGGTPREDDWARTPVQPTILCSTVDQVGSRLLFRGYGVSDAMKPIHAGLIGSDCLILLDEAYLSEPFRQTLNAIKSLRAPDQAPFGIAILTATPTVKAEQPFALSDADRKHPILSRRLDAKKPAQLVEMSGKQGEDTDRRAEAVAREVTTVLARLQVSGIAQPAVGVVVNRVARARSVFERLRAELKESARVIMLIGPARAIDQVAKELGPIRTGHPEPPRQLRETLIVVATQTIEAGVDIDLDGLVTEAAAFDALRQRFGRLNRAGRSIVPEAVVVAHKEDLGAKADPIYEDRIKKTWEALKGLANRAGAIDFGVQTLRDRIGENAAELAAPVKDAPILMPAYADLWSQTSPIPNADAEAALFLHGPNSSPAAVQIVWRADVHEQDDLRPAMGNEAERARLVELFKLVPPRAAEAIEVPLWALRAWLKQAGVKQADFSDTVERGREEENERRAGRCAFRWAGEDSDHTGVVYGSALRNGDLIVVPADYGGSDQWGWHPHASDRVTDVAEKAAWPYHARRFAVRVTPELIEQEIRQQRGSEDNSNTDAGGHGELAALLGQTLGDHGEEPTEILLDAVLALKLPPELKARLEMLRAQGRRRGHLERKFAHRGTSEPARGVIFIAPRGLKPNGDAMALSATPSTETEELGAASDHALDLVTHCKDVHAWAATFAVDAGLPPPVAEDVGLAGLLHDLGKADPRYQAYYAGGTPYGPDAERALAKSGQARLPPGAWERAGLPPRWRHEALSVRLAMLHPDFKRAHDPELVLWLIGTHHGHGRPLFPHADPLDAEKRRFGLPRALGAGLMLEAIPGPQSLAFDFEGRDWARIFECLKEKYGIWGLARLEAFVRLADHRASELAGPPERTGYSREAAE